MTPDGLDRWDASSTCATTDQGATLRAAQASIAWRWAPIIGRGGTWAIAIAGRWGRITAGSRTISLPLSWSLTLTGSLSWSLTLTGSLSWSLTLPWSLPWSLPVSRSLTIAAGLGLDAHGDAKTQGRRQGDTGYI